MLLWLRIIGCYNMNLGILSHFLKRIFIFLLYIAKIINKVVTSASFIYSFFLFFLIVILLFPLVFYFSFLLWSSLLYYCNFLEWSCTFLELLSFDSFGNISNFLVMSSLKFFSVVSDVIEIIWVRIILGLFFNYFLFNFGSLYRRFVDLWTPLKIPHLWPFFLNFIRPADRSFEHKFRFFHFFFYFFL